MRRSSLLGFGLMALSMWAQAQEIQQPRLLGNVYFAPGAAIKRGYQYRTYQFGGGGEVRIYKGLSAGAELGVLASERAGLFSTNAAYHFPRATRNGKLSPFLTAGYTATGGPEWSESWFNFGGGADYWFKKKVGLRLEFRDQVDTNHDAPIHFVGGRIGIVWR